MECKFWLNGECQLFSKKCEGNCEFKEKLDELDRKKERKCK